MQDYVKYGIQIPEHDQDQVDLKYDIKTFDYVKPKVPQQFSFEKDKIYNQRLDHSRSIDFSKDSSLPSEDLKNLKDLPITKPNKNQNNLAFKNMNIEIKQQPASVKGHSHVGFKLENPFHEGERVSKVDIQDTEEDIMDDKEIGHEHPVIQI